jgi:hypothetical protein
VTRAALHQRLALAGFAAGAGMLAWRAAEAAAALAPALFLLSGVGLGMFVVGAILLLGAVMQGRAAGTLNVFQDPASRAATVRALYAGVATTFIAAGVAVLVVTLGGGPAAPLDLVLTFGAAAFLLTFAWGHAQLSRG